MIRKCYSKSQKGMNKMKKDLVSLIVAIYNVEECLERCVESLLVQTYENIEILLINDGSPDNSEEICKKFAESDKRVRYFHKENGGLSSARNFGIKKAEGEYICFIDGDDFMDRRYVETLYKNIKDYDVKMSTVSFRVYHDGDDIQEDIIDNSKIEKFNTEEAIHHLFTKEKFCNYAWNKMFHYSLFEEIEFPIGRKMEDLAVMYRLAEQCDFVTYNPAKLCNYYQRGTSILHNRDKKFYDDKFFLVHERYLDLKKKFPNLLRNDLYMMIVILDCYPYMDENSNDEKIAEALMEKFPKDFVEHFPERYKKRCEYYFTDKKLYRDIYKTKTDKD